MSSIRKLTPIAPHPDANDAPDFGDGPEGPGGPETWELCRMLLKAIGRGRFSRAVGRDWSTVYRWGREPMSERSADGTGTTNLLDWFEALVETTGSVPGARASLLQVEQWTRALFDRVLRRSDVREVSHQQVVDACLECIHEHSEAMEVAIKEGQDDVALVESLQARDCYDRLTILLQARIDHANGEGS